MCGCSFLFRTGLALIHMNQSTLLSSNFEQCLDVLMHPSPALDCNALFDSIAAITLSANKFDSLVRQHSKMRETAQTDS